MVWLAIEANVSLDEFSEDDLISHLEKQGYTCVKGKVQSDCEHLAPIDLDRISHLAICGQKAAAMEELILLTEQAIGCSLH